VSSSLFNRPASSLNLDIEGSAQTQFACHGDTLDISCPLQPWDSSSSGRHDHVDFPPDGESVIVLTSARYGLGSSPVLARQCRVPFSRPCDVDVHHALNRACAGRRKCSVSLLSGGHFGRPCGGIDGEFLSVEYRCVSGGYKAYRGILSMLVLSVLNS
jgi:hypothetical protein